MLLLVDLDGVVYRAAAPVPGVAAVLAARAAAGDDVVYVTNNALYHRTEYVERLAGLGAPVAPDRVVSSARATALYLVGRHPRPRRVLALGAEGLRRELQDVGLEVVMAGAAAERRRTDHLDALDAAGHPDVVVVGLDRDLTYERLAITSEVVRAGVLFVATNRDPVFPAEHSLQPGSGSIVVSVETASGITPISIGKPAPYLLEQAAAVVGRKANEAVMIGDSLVTDLPAARAVGARFVLMLTGVTTRHEVDRLSPELAPDAVASNADELAGALKRLSVGLSAGQS